MKTILIFCFIMVLVGSECKKEKTTNFQEKTLSPIPTGSWKWISTWRDAPRDSTNPMTPENTGIQKILIFSSDYAWKRIYSGSTMDSGTFTLGHGSITPNKGGETYIYDSIVYYQNGTFLHDSQYARGTDYYQLSKDTLLFCGCFIGLYGPGVTTYIKK